GPLRVRVGLVPIDMYHRKLSLKRQPFIEDALKPSAAVFFPIKRMRDFLVADSPRRGLFAVEKFCERLREGRGAAVVEPLPTLIRPELFPAVAAVVYERGELRVRHRIARDAKRLHLDGVRPFLIVEDEKGIARSAEHESPAGDADVC